MTIRERSRKAIYAFLRNPISDPFVKLVKRIDHHIEAERKESMDRLYARICGDKTVRNGPFKGMRYPELFSQGSALLPKILGCYEMELHETFERLLKKGYAEIVDIGSAEGYYAVGLALRSKAMVYAYEIDEKSGDFCRRMAKENGVGDRVIIKGECTAKMLSSFHFTNGLVISDCEGYEDSLFTASSLKNLRDCDIIIELHELDVPGISKRLFSLFATEFSRTHVVSLIPTQPRSIRQFKKLFAGTDSWTKEEALSEWRKRPMKWLIVEREART